jgi:hypothetical protein
LAQRFQLTPVRRCREVALSSKKPGGRPSLRKLDALAAPVPKLGALATEGNQMTERVADITHITSKSRDFDQLKWEFDEKHGRKD